MLLAKGHRLAAFDVKGRVLYAGVMRATFAADVNHSVLSVFITEDRRPSVLVVEAWPPRAGVI